jgi:hypothetical protein
MAGSCEPVNKPSGSIKGRKCISEQLLASQKELCFMESVETGIKIDT